MLRSILMKPEITAEDIRLAEGLRSPFWDDPIEPEDDPIIIVAIDLFNKIRAELLSIRTQLAIYGVVLYFLSIMLSITLDFVLDKNVTFLDPFLIFFTVWFALCFIQGWRLFRLVVNKDRAVDQVAKDSLDRYSDWLEDLKKTDPDKFVKIMTWESDIAHFEARLKLNEYF